MKHRAVVANFLFRWSNTEQTEQQVALFRRSYHPNIRSYQGKYAPVSGSIESDDDNPLTAAKREIEEETKLNPDRDITLDFCGKSYFFEDKEANRSWTVHPFSWTLLVPDDTIQIDWEHDSWGWFDPNEILTGSMNDECVPKLTNSLSRVYLSPQGIFQASGAYAPPKLFLSSIHTLRDSSNLPQASRTATALTHLETLAQNLSIPGESKDNTLSPPSPFPALTALSTIAYHLIHSVLLSRDHSIAPALLTALEWIAQVTATEPSRLRIMHGHLRTYISQRLYERHDDDGTAERQARLTSDITERSRVEERFFGGLYVVEE